MGTEKAIGYPYNSVSPFHTCIKRKGPGDIASPGPLSKEAATYSPALHCSTIGASGLNFSVRNGKRWDPAAIAT